MQETILKNGRQYPSHPVYNHLLLNVGPPLGLIKYKKKYPKGL